MPSDARSRSPPPPPPRATTPPNPRLPGFPRWRGPMSTAINMAGRPSFPPAPPSIPPSQISMFSQPTPMMFNPYIPTMPQSQLPPSQPMPTQPTPMTPAPSTPCSPTQPCPATPSQQSNSPASAGCTPQPRRNIQSSPAGSTREYGFDLNEHWQQDAEFYDNQKINGLTFPRSIRSSAFTTKLDIEGCDPLKLPVAALMYQQHNNLWLRKLAWGRELYLVPVGDLAGVVFTTELLSQLRARGIDIDRVCQNKARQEGKTLDKTGNTKFAAQLIAEHIQKLASYPPAPTRNHITKSLLSKRKLRNYDNSWDRPMNHRRVLLPHPPRLQPLSKVPSFEALAKLLLLVLNPHRFLRCQAVKILGLPTTDLHLLPKPELMDGSNLWISLHLRDPHSLRTWRRSSHGGMVKEMKPFSKSKRWQL